MKRTILILMTGVLLCTTTQAQEEKPKRLEYCMMPSAVNAKSTYLRPSKARKVLEELERNVGEQKLLEALGKPTLQSLRSYSALDDQQIYMNAYLAAAAGGAAVAVVEYVWDRVFGNGKEGKITIPNDYFDVPTIPRPKIPQQRSVGYDPVALTPAVGTAVVGAVAYKAAEYSLNKLFGSRDSLESYDVRSFDLDQNQQQL